MLGDVLPEGAAEGSSAVVGAPVFLRRIDAFAGCKVVGSAVGANVGNAVGIIVGAGVGSIDGGEVGIGFGSIDG